MDEVETTEVVVRFTGGPHDGQYFSLPFPLGRVVSSDFLSQTRLPLEETDATWGVYAYDSDRDAYFLMSENEEQASGQIKLVIDAADWFATFETRLDRAEKAAEEGLGAKFGNFLLVGVLIGVLLGYLIWGIT